MSLHPRSGSSEWAEHFLASPSFRPQTAAQAETKVTRNGVWARFSFFELKTYSVKH